MSLPHFHATPLRRLPLAALLSLAFAGASQAQSLVDIYEMAKGYDATYQSAKAQYDANLAKADQGKAQLLPQVRDVRRLGSAALDLCMVAAGRLDAHYEHGLNVWDWAAGALIAAEAGAVVRLPAPGEPLGLTLAAAPGVADALCAALARCGALGPLPGVAGS